jgi:peroxiredoxin
VLRRVPYQHGPTRYEYRLTDSGRALLAVLVVMQDWGDRWLLGDGTLTGSAAPESAEAARVAGLQGKRVPALTLPAHLGGDLDVIDQAAGATVLFCYPATGTPAPLPENWNTIPGAVGCTLENRLFRDAYPQFQAFDVAVRGISTQRPGEQAAFAKAEDIPFPLLSDMDLHLAAALRLPTFHAGQGLRLKRAVLVADRDRTIHEAIFPVIDIPAAIRTALDKGRNLTGSAGAAHPPGGLVAHESGGVLP